MYYPVKVLDGEGNVKKTYSSKYLSDRGDKILALGGYEIKKRGRPTKLKKEDMDALGLPMPEPQPNRFEKTCLYCKKKFVEEIGAGKFCTPEHRRKRQASQRKAHKARTQEKRKELQGIFRQKRG